MPNSFFGKELELKLRFADEIHQYVREYIRLADQKASFFFASVTAILAYLHHQGLTTIWLRPPTGWGFNDMVAFAATVGLFVSAVACLATVLPRLYGSKRGLIYFSAIREYDSARDYSNEVIKQSSEDLLDAKLKHAYDLSDICNRKYDVLKWGQWAGAIGVIASLLLLVLSQQ